MFNKKFTFIFSFFVAIFSIILIFLWSNETVEINFKENFQDLNKNLRKIFNIYESSERIKIWTVRNFSLENFEPLRFPFRKSF